MEYRCLIVGDPIVEPGALLRRLLYLDFPPHEERCLKRQSLRDMRDLETRLLATPESVDDFQSGIFATPSLRRDSAQRAMCVSMPSPDECTLRLPNPSIPSVDITIRFSVVTEPRDVLAVLGVPAFPSNTGPQTSSIFGASLPGQAYPDSGATPAAYHPGMMPHAVVAVYNPFARRSFSKMRVEWRHFLSAINDAKETLAHGTGPAGHYHSSHALNNGLSRANTFSGFTNSHSTDPHAGPAGPVSFAPSHTRMGFTMVDGSPESPMSPVSAFGPSAAVQRGPSAVYESLANPSLAPPLLLVGTRFELMREAIEATPGVTPPAPREVWELAVALGAKSYAEVGAYWDDAFDDLRLTIARACVGELSHSPVVRAPITQAVRQSSVTRCLDEVVDNTFAEPDTEEKETAAAEPTADTGDEAARRSTHSSDAGVDVDVDTSGDADPQPDRAKLAARHAEGEGGASATTATVAGEASANASTSVVPVTPAVIAAKTKSGKSRWTWRRHPDTARLFYVCRATRHSQYTRPDDYDGTEPDAEQVSEAALRATASDTGALSTGQMCSHALPCKPDVSVEAAEAERADDATDLAADSDAPPSLARGDAPPSVAPSSLPPLAPVPAADAPDDSHASSDMLQLLSAASLSLVGVPAARSEKTGTSATAPAAGAHELGLDQQLAQKEACLANLTREVALLHEKQHVLHLQRDQNAKLRALFDTTRRDLVTKQKTSQTDHETAMAALQKEASALEARLDDLMHHIPAAPTHSGHQGTRGGLSSADRTAGLGAAPSFLFTPEEWAVARHATAAEKERLLLERAVQSAAEQLQRTLADVDAEQQRAGQSFRACETLLAQQRVCQEAVDALVAQLAEQEVHQAVLDEAARAAQRELRHEMDTAHTQRLLEQNGHRLSPLRVKSARDPLSPSQGQQADLAEEAQAGTDSQADAETPEMLRAHIVRTGRALQRLLRQTSAASLVGKGETALVGSAEDSSNGNGTANTDALCLVARAWLLQAMPSRDNITTAEAINSIPAQLVAIGRDSFRVSSAWRSLHALRQSLGLPTDTASNQGRHISSRQEEKEGLLRARTTSERVPSLVNDAEMVMDALVQLAVESVSALDANFVDPRTRGSAYAVEDFMSYFWWRLLNRSVAVALTEAAPSAPGALWDAVRARAVAADGIHGDFYEALTIEMDSARLDTSTET